MKMRCWGIEGSWHWLGEQVGGACTGWDAVPLFSETPDTLVELSPPVEWSSFAPILQGLVMQRLELTGLSRASLCSPPLPVFFS